MVSRLRFALTNTVIGSLFMAFGFAGVMWMFVYILASVGFHSTPPDPVREANSGFLTTFAISFVLVSVFFGLLQMACWGAGAGDGVAHGISMVLAILSGVMLGVYFGGVTNWLLAAWEVRDPLGLALLRTVTAVFVSFIIACDWELLAFLAGIIKTNVDGDNALALGKACAWTLLVVFTIIVWLPAI